MNPDQLAAEAAEDLYRRGQITNVSIVTEAFQAAIEKATERLRIELRQEHEWNDELREKLSGGDCNAGAARQESNVTDTTVAPTHSRAAHASEPETGYSIGDKLVKPTPDET